MQLRIVLASSGASAFISVTGESTIRDVYSAIMALEMVTSQNWVGVDIFYGGRKVLPEDYPKKASDLLLKGSSIMILESKNSGPCDEPVPTGVQPIHEPKPKWTEPTIPLLFIIYNETRHVEVPSNATFKEIKINHLEPLLADLPPELGVSKAVNMKIIVGGEEASDDATPVSIDLHGKSMLHLVRRNVLETDTIVQGCLKFNCKYCLTPGAQMSLRFACQHCMNPGVQLVQPVGFTEHGTHTWADLIHSKGKCHNPDCTSNAPIVKGEDREPDYRVVDTCWGFRCMALHGEDQARCPGCDENFGSTVAIYRPGDPKESLIDILNAIFCHPHMNGFPDVAP